MNSNLFILFMIAGSSKSVQNIGYCGCFSRSSSSIHQKQAEPQRRVSTVKNRMISVVL